ncbi:peptidoglycan DD-metalloendopeptidase family protein [Heliobacterium gestii]|uniref:Peptidoglycan DD-metalloendopeptidase family protein n=1 Tax=Heliomicrobium gestii TaxID=2699 RepID=A0A845LDK6_HELGE|nr:peptidoglycan DD-metalloendopeptidase family protein [Heliomicrobium gestii]MBM7865955.1 UDP-N-acetylmuramoyl-tripeptide--D-alanyl-D-alanine ligase [Heliomicrobium gestii]MZP42709.1 peptidoglycan DD-metalloendopeptidase family protein [Heliomicrobium gestii]
MNEWNVGAIVAATGGELLSGRPEDPVRYVCERLADCGKGDVLIPLVNLADPAGYAVRAAGKRVGALVLPARAASAAANAGVPVIGAASVRDAYFKLVKAYRRRCKARIVAVTGSAGKTTTKEMLAAVLAEAGEVQKNWRNYNGPYGIGYTLFRLRPRHAFGVVEVGAYIPNSIDFGSRLAAPEIGVITCIGLGHAKDLGGREGVRREKEKLLKHLPEKGLLVLNGDDPGCRSLELTRCKAPVRWVGLEREMSALSLWAERIQVHRNGTRFQLCGLEREVEVELPGFYGRPAVIDALLVAAVADHVGLSPEAIAKGFTKVQQTPGRFSPIHLPGRRLLIDATYNANPHSMSASLESAARLAEEGKRLAIVGTMSSLGEEAPAQHRSIGKLAAELGFGLIALGQYAKTMAEGATEAGGRVLYASEKWEKGNVVELALKELPEEGVLLVKASHSVELEIVADAIEKEAARQSGLVPPLAKFEITRNFGFQRHPITREWAAHEGIDLFARRGTAIVAASAGTVNKVELGHPIYGHHLEIDHGDGIVTGYAHLHKVYVQVGDRVAQDQPIAEVGSSGRTTGPHLHYEVRFDGKAVDPYYYVIR